MKKQPRAKSYLNKRPGTRRAGASSPAHGNRRAAPVEAQEQGKAKKSVHASWPSQKEQLRAEIPVSVFPTAGIGASAGGLEAFTQLLKHLPVDAGMGFVFVQHLDPAHDSALTQLLGRATSMPVREVTNGLRIEPNNVYVIPPNTNMGIRQGVLTLSARLATGGAHRSIDFFFESLAADQRERAIGVILSGTATDGTIGLEAIKAEGGITIAQDESAKYDSMPRSAIAAGCVDFVLPPERIANELARIARHPYVVNQSREEAGTHAGQSVAEVSAANHFKKILVLLRNRSGVDFSLYKPSTIQRRITRRMVLNKLGTFAEYGRFLRGNTRELDALYSDVLISVTSFFRNPEAFETLKRRVFARLLRPRRDDPVRVWVPGCSTGQEAYSIAMAFLEVSRRAVGLPRLQIFGTDLNDALLEKARHGLYLKSLLQDVSPERLRRFFTEEHGGYRVNKSVRQMCIFARQNFITDPPFSRVDLISCRNLLIYVEQSVQKKVLPIFHHALKAEGFLFLGASESIGTFSNLFAPVDKKQKIYAKRAARTPPLQLKLGPRHPGVSREMPAAKPSAPAEAFPYELNLQHEADRISLNKYAPPGVLINAQMEILQFRGATRPFLQPPAGKASFNLMKMAREGLMLPLRAAISKAKKEHKVVRRENVRVSQNGNDWMINVEVIPLRNLNEPCYLVLFEKVEEKKARHALPGEPSPEPIQRRGGGAGTDRAAGRKVDSRRIAELERELGETRDYLQAVLEASEAANEELQASNEEVQSANEELQSINEELETSKEELESTNEELTTVNDEMASRSTELNRHYSDLNNLYVSLETAILLLGRDLTVRRFTPTAGKIFNLLAGDVGRPLFGIKHRLDFPELEKFIAEVIDTMSVREREVQDKDGRWYSMRALPYLTLENKIDGAVVMLVDIDKLKRREQQIRDAHDYAAAIVESVPPLLILDRELRVMSANESFYNHFHVSPSQTEHRLVYDLGNGQWDIPTLRIFLEETLQRNSSFNDFEVTHEFATIGRRTMLLSGRRVGQLQKILLAIVDVTERKHAAELEALVTERTAALHATVGELEAFSHSIAHDMRAPLRGMQGFAQQLMQEHAGQLDAQGVTYLQRIAASAIRMDKLIQDSLSYTRISRSQVPKEPVDLDKLLRDIVDTYPDWQPPKAEIQIEGTLPTVLGNEAFLTQCISNLLSNAVKFVSPGIIPRVRILAEAIDSQARLWFEDNGIGIGPEDHERIFRMFARIHPANEYEGTGIGLTIVSKAVERMGGQVGFESELGKGSKFWIQFDKG